MLILYCHQKKNINITRLFTVPSSRQMQFFQFQSMYLLSCVCPSVLGFRSPIFVGGVGVYRLFSSIKQRHSGGGSGGGKNVQLYMKKKSNDGGHGASHGGKLSLDFGVDFSGCNSGFGVGVSSGGGGGTGGGGSSVAIRNRSLPRRGLAWTG